MKKVLFSTLCVAVLACTALFFQSFTTKKQSQTIKIYNNSKWDIDHIYISHVDKASWGSDLLGSDEVMTPGEYITVKIECAIYDVKLVDEDGVICELADVTICDDDSIWAIGDLTKCK